MTLTDRSFASPERVSWFDGVIVTELKGCVKGYFEKSGEIESNYQRKVYKIFSPP